MLYGFSSRVEITGNKISGLEDISVKFTYSEQQREYRIIIIPIKNRASRTFGTIAKVLSLASWGNPRRRGESEWD